MDLSSSEKKLLQALHEKEHFIEQVTNNTPDIIYVYDLDRRKNIYTNSRVLDLLGPENLTMDMIHPLDYPKRKEHINSCKALVDNQVCEIDVRLKAKNGSWNWFRMRDVPFKRNPDGTVNQVIGTARDIHERKLTEEALKQKEELLQGVLNTPGLGLSAYKAIRNKAGDILDFEFVLVSKTTEQFHQRTDLMGKWLFEEFPDRKGQYEDLRRVVETGDTHIFDISFIVEGKERWYHVSIAKFGDGFIKIWEDITEKKLDEQKIKEQINLMHRITGSTPDIIMVYDFDLDKYIYVNQEIADIIGIPKKQIKEPVSDLMRSLIHPEDQERTIAFIEAMRAVPDETIIENTYRLRHASGKWLWFYTRGMAFQRDASGSVVQYMTISQDITKLKETQKEQGIGFEKKAGMQEANDDTAQKKRVSMHRLSEDDL